MLVRSEPDRWELIACTFGRSEIARSSGTALLPERRSLPLQPEIPHRRSMRTLKLPRSASTHHPRTAAMAVDSSWNWHTARSWEGDLRITGSVAGASKSRQAALSSAHVTEPDAAALLAEGPVSLNWKAICLAGSASRPKMRAMRPPCLTAADRLSSGVAASTNAVIFSTVSP